MREYANMNVFSLACKYLVLAGVVCVASRPGRELTASDECPLGPFIRPIVFVTGFRGSFLFNSSENFALEFIDEKDFAPGPNSTVEDGAQDLALPLLEDNVVQKKTPVGPELAPNDKLPGLFGPSRDFIESQPSTQFIKSITDGWVNETEVDQLLFTVSWDFRRDFYEQSELVHNMVKHARQKTGCKPLLVCFSLGGLACYSGFSRYGKDFADNLHSIAYAVVPLQPASPILTAFAIGLPGDPPVTPLIPSTLFTYANLWSLVPPLNISCVNLTPSGETRECEPGELQTGISCNNAACGRPDDWPEGKPFFLPIDLRNATTHTSPTFPIGRIGGLFLENPDQIPVLPDSDLDHIKGAIKMTDRTQEALLGVEAAAIAKLHPPTLSLSMTLNELAVPGKPPQDIRQPGALGCEGIKPPQGAPPVACSSFTPLLVPSDGFLPSAVTFFRDPSLFGDNLQELNATTFPNIFLAGAEGFSPHVGALASRDTPLDSFVDCEDFSLTVEEEPGKYPALEDIVCSLVLRGNAAAGITANDSADNITDASGSSARAGAARAVAALVATVILVIGTLL